MTIGLIGLVGLGIMGTAYAKNFIAAGQTVAGADPSEDARNRCAELGVEVHEAAGAWLNQCDLVVLSLVSPTVLLDVASILARDMNPGQVVVETGTFAMDDKVKAREILEASDITLLDCTISGTGVQADAKDIIFMASGPEDAKNTARPFLEMISKKVIDAGDFGGGTRLKLIANHAVALHNVAAAETLNYAVKMGLDQEVIYDLLSTGAGQSKMSDLRMPLMMSGTYEPATASLMMFKKDLEIIGDDIKKTGAHAPLFEACVELYKQADATLPEHLDTASVYEIYANNREDL
ncbi:MAG: NAD-binding protein [Rhizobiaceae bacterium]|nr:NAD-binding protein [Rhizobiaceae bacterium]